MKTNTKAYKGHKIYIVDHSRTPFIKARGEPGPFSASQLAVTAGRALLLRQNIAPEHIDEVILGCVNPSPDEANIARLVALRLGLGHKISAQTVQRNCASGLQAIDTAAMNIAAGRSDIILAGGTEAMSRAPLIWQPALVRWLAHWQQAKDLSHKGRALLRLRPQYLSPIIALLRGLRDPLVNLSMGQTAERIADRFQLTRQQLDEYAVRSHQRLQQAYDQQQMHEIEPLYASDGRYWDQDDGLRPDSSVEKLAKLKPAFEAHGKVTAGNSAQITDGASCLLLASERAVEKHQLPVIARILDSHWAGLDPRDMGLGPAYAIGPLLKRNHLNTDDIANWEINEAFAAQILACQTALADDDFCQTELQQNQAVGTIPDQTLNIHGGGISLGHPVGASGARISGHLAHTLNQLAADKTSPQRGIASLCIGGGQGGAILLESA